MPEDGNKEERLNIIEYVSKCLSSCLPKEANDTQKIHYSLSSLNVLIVTFFFFFFLSDICVPLSLRTIFFLYTPSISHPDPPSLRPKFLLATLVLSEEGGRRSCLVVVRLILFNHMLALFRANFACNLAYRNPVFRWE